MSRLRDEAPRAVCRVIVLASQSPRRRELLAALGIPFEVHPPPDDEHTSESDPVRIAEGLALRKARAISARFPDAVVIGSDTVVVLDGVPLGKPTNAEDALRMLQSLRGREHQVVTGVSALAGSRVAGDHSSTAVTIRSLTDEEIQRYVRGGSPLDKAGAYAIQDDLRPVEWHRGCECGVMGLPLWLTRRLLLAVAPSLAVDAPSLPRCASCPERR